MTPGGLPAQVLVCCYHKTGTVLFRNVMQKVADRLGLRFAELYGKVDNLPAEFDIVMLSHSLIGFTVERPLCGIRLLRDPRDVWVSGYQYHLHCREAWCVNSDVDYAGAIRFPLIPASVEHRRERWKREYLKSLGGRSYQQNLRDRDRAAGMEFELDHYTGATMDAMRAWRPMRGVVDMQLEAVVADYDNAMRSIFSHLGFSPESVAVAVELAATEDIMRMADAAVAANAHIHSRSLSRWRSLLSDGEVAEFERRHGDLILALGYGLSAL